MKTIILMVLCLMMFSAAVFAGNIDGTDCASIYCRPTEVRIS